MLDERREGDAEPLLLRFSQRHERAATALHEERRLAAQQNHLRAGDARRPSTGSFRPRQRGAVRLRGIRCSQHQRVCVLAALTQLADPLDRAAERELCAAEPFDEVTATTETECLKRTQLCVHRAVAAGNALGAHAVAGDDALPLEQELGERAALRGACEQPLGARPASSRRRRALRTPA